MITIDSMRLLLLMLFLFFMPLPSHAYTPSCEHYRKCYSLESLRMHFVRAREVVAASFQTRTGTNGEYGVFSVQRSWKGTLSRGANFHYYLGPVKSPGDEFLKPGTSFVLFMTSISPQGEPTFRASGCYRLSPIELRRRHAHLRELQIVFTLDVLSNDL